MSIKKKSSIEEKIKERNLLSLNEQISEYTNYDNIQNPLNFKSWWNTLLGASDAPYHIRVKLYETALSYLPASYKLWYNYLKEAREYISQFQLPDKRYEIINNLHERALIYMAKMPRIYLDYCNFLEEQCLITKTRKIYNLALKNLPATQHKKIWKSYLEWAIKIDSESTIINVYKRYMKINPDIKEDYIDFLIGTSHFEEAIKNIIQILNDDMFYSKKNRTQYNYWMFLCQIIEKFPEIAKKFNVENIIRHGINKYSEEIGRLWVALANYFIKIKQFNKSREIFEEALEKVLTVRDFTLVFNTYLKFEEELAKSGIEDYDNENDGNGENDNMNIDDSNIESSLKEAFTELKIKNEDGDLFEDNNTNNNNNLDENEEMKLTYEEKLNFKFLRLNNLLERRPLMLCLTKLRQNPNNVKEWIQKISLCKNYDSIIETYEEAINTIIPEKAFGNLSELYINYANYYEQYNEIEKMNNIYFRACNVNYNKIHENIDMWCLWIEKQLNFRNYNDAYIIIKTVCTNKKYSRYNKSLILWSLYVDLESNFGNEENIRKIYDKMIELKIANIQTIFNYCSYLEKRNFFEETFRIFEQGIFYFQWPGLYDLWIVYIIKFINRYKGKKIERIRDMYEEVIKQCPKDKIKIFYYIFAYYEEEYGSFNHCINILDKGANDVPQNDKAFIYSILISKTSKYFGITKTRNFFNKAMDNLDKDHILEIGLKYISIESKLGELGRARSIFKHLSQFFNPTNEVLKESFWDVWEQFEIIHGNSDTYYDMNVIKSQVKNQYSLNIPLLNFEKGE